MRVHGWTVVVKQANHTRMTFSQAGPLWTLVLVLTGLLAFPPSMSSANATVSAPTDEHLRSALEAFTAQGRIRVGAEELAARSALRRFYRERAYHLAWSRDGAVLPAGEELLGILQEVEQEGLRGADYHRTLIAERLRAIRRDQEAAQPLPPHALVEIDLLLTDAFLSYGAHLATGRIDPQRHGFARLARRPTLDLVPRLHTALATHHIASVLHDLRPPHAGYLRLRQALERYRRLAAAGGWSVVPSGPPLRQGDRSPRVRLVRRRLAVTGELDAGWPPSQDGVFDAALTHAVQVFQARHGVGADGVVGAATLAALNVSVAARIRQLEVNLERWRWLPPDLGPRVVVVNIPDFSLAVVEHGASLLPMRVVVGKPSWETPSFSASITALVLNPSWNVPRRIAITEVLPAIRKNPRYLAKHSLQILPVGGARTRARDSRTVPQALGSSTHLPYRFRQAPGPTNPLGRLKFVLPNEFDVYLHDTPSRTLFTKTTRAFSHGCIRVETPLALAEYLVREDARWTGETLQAAVAHGRERLVPLPQPIPIYLLYWTAWVDGDDTVQFRPDIYKRDPKVDKALQLAAAR